MENYMGISGVKELLAKEKISKRDMSKFLTLSPNAFRNYLIAWGLYDEKIRDCKILPKETVIQVLKIISGD